jgi:hypothetical protein
MNLYTHYDYKHWQRKRIKQNGEIKFKKS